MKKLDELYRKSELAFAIFWIVLYVLLSMAADALSAAVGVSQSVTAILLAVMCGVLWDWIGRNDRRAYYGFRAPDYPASRFLFYIPLVIIGMASLWTGIDRYPSAPEIYCNVLTMLCVGFLEEIIFRGFLFRAMAKDNVRTAAIVSSVTFGLGHIVNLLTGKPLADTLVQIVFAIAVGFIMVLIVHRGGSIIPCILFHSLNNAFATLSAPSRMSPQVEMTVSLAMTVVLGLGYVLWLLKALPKKEGA